MARTNPVPSSTTACRGQKVADRTSARRIVLQELPTAAAPKATAKSRGGGGGRTRPTPPPTTAPRKTNCDPPYYVTAEGLKRFKPECL